MKKARVSATSHTPRTDLGSYVRPADHIRRGPVQRHEVLVLEHGIRQVDTEHELEQTEAQSDGAVLAPQRLERCRVKDLAPFSELRFTRHRVDIIDAMHEEASVTARPGVLEETLLEPMTCESRASVSGCQTADIENDGSSRDTHSCVI